MAYTRQDCSIVWSTTPGNYKHLKNIFESGELIEDSVSSILEHTAGRILQFNEEAVLKHQGKVSHDVAMALAENEFEKYRIIQDKLLESDFDRDLRKLKK